MNPFGGMIRMNRMIPAGLGGRRKTPQLNPFRGAPLGAIQPQYHLPKLRGKPMYDLPDLQDRQSKQDRQSSQEPQRDLLGMIELFYD